MSMIINPFVFGVSNIPAYSLAFDLHNNPALSMSSANFGTFDKAKWSVSIFVKQSSLGAVGGDRVLRQQYGAAGNKAYRILLTTANKIRIITYADGTNIDGELLTTATYTSTDYFHIKFDYDSANATAGDRMRLWVNGSEVTSFDTDDNPSAAVYASTANHVIGGNTTSSIEYFDGYQFQHAFFSGSLPSISEVYNAGSPVDITAVSGLYSVLSAPSANPVVDGVLATNWTNHLVSTSVIVP